MSLTKVTYSMIDASILNVLDYGADPTGAADSTTAFRNAMTACFDATPDYVSGGLNYFRAKRALFVPPGTYTVTATIFPTRGANDRFLGFSMYGVPAGTQYDAGGSTRIETLTSIVADPAAAWIADQSVIDLQYHRSGSFRNLCVKGVSGVTKGVDFSFGAWWTIEDCNFSLHKYGAYHNQSGGIQANRNQYTNCTHAGLWMKDSGDSNIDNCYVNGNNPDYATDQNQGWGIFLATSSNSNIRGGKNEYNAIGVYLLENNGINISGVNFDLNYQTHVLVVTESTSATPDPFQVKSINIVGNRFLGGGFNNNALGRAHIIVYSSQANSYLTVTGNSFRKGAGSAYDENPFSGVQPVGPQYVVYAYHDGGGVSQINNYAISGNNMYNGANVNTILAVANGGASVDFVGINVWNLPNFTLGANVDLTNFL